MLKAQSAIKRLAPGPNGISARAPERAQIARFYHRYPERGGFVSQPQDSCRRTKRATWKRLAVLRSYGLEGLRIRLIDAAHRLLQGLADIGGDHAHIAPAPTF